ncbi:hypothetical protein ACJ73_09802 [Blastomyces percursus]|uniref:Uncharacterized protein n=1 Tax=Blastomyces percursus TaxID=1658174 RepID=A0A1J9Q2B3_9EURO|nr:hypothetical protein ACJ73_09802 [Blastomyces percursus]
MRTSVHPGVQFCIQKLTRFRSHSLLPPILCVADGRLLLSSRRGLPGYGATGSSSWDPYAPDNGIYAQHSMYSNAYPSIPDNNSTTACKVTTFERPVERQMRCAL